MELLNILMNQIEFFATVLIVGFLSVKSGIITDENVTSFSRIILRVIVPIMVITIIVSSGTREELFSMGPFCVGVFIMFAVLIITSFVFGKVFRLKQPLINVFICSSSFVNSALFGYPIIMAMFPKESGLAIAVFLLVETIIIWTVGVMILTYDKDQGKKIDFKRMMTPMTISLIIAMIMLLLDIKPKGIVWDSLCGIGGTQKYMGLMYIGMDIGRRGFKKLFENLKVFLVSPVKLIISPLVVFGVLKALNIVNDNYIMILVIFSMLPTMMIITMLANEYECYPEYASAALLSTTVLSLFTMPFVFWLITSVLV